MVQLSKSPTSASAGRGRTPQASSWLEIDLSRLEANVHALRGVLGAGGRDSASETPQPPDSGPQPLLCGVVKKNAYGLGASAVAHQLSKAGCDMLAVYSAEEAEQLIRASVETPILIFMPVSTLDRTSVLYRHAIAGKLHLTLHDADQLHALNEVGRTFGMRMPVHLDVDTGMSRAGMGEQELHEILAALPTLRFIEPAGLCSHLASADEDPAFTEQQRVRFEAIAEAARPALSSTTRYHLANTFGTLRDPRLHMDMVRCGLGLLGYGPESIQHAADGFTPPDLAPVLRWLSRVIHVQRQPAGATVGYGATHTLERDSLLGIVPVGYGDGYPLGLSNQAKVRLLDDAGTPTAECHVLGRVNMDQIVIDLTDAATGEPQAMIDRPLELISHDPAAPNALPRLADLAGLHCYAILCGLSPNLPRHYVR